MSHNDILIEAAEELENYAFMILKNEGKNLTTEQHKKWITEIRELADKLRKEEC